MKFLFASLQHYESDFFGRVGGELVRSGHEVAHLTYSRRASIVLRDRGFESYCLPDLMRDVAPGPRDEEEARIVRRYGLRDLREVFRTDPNCRSLDDEARATDWTIRQFVAIERLCDRLRPEAVVPEVGNEAMRAIAHLVGRDRGATTWYLLYTIFDQPLRLYANTVDAPIVPAEDVRQLSTDEERELDGFIDRFKRRDRPIRAHERTSLRPRRWPVAMRHFAVRLLWDRDNVYLRPAAWVARDLRRRSRELAARRLYSDAPPGRFVYFPLQVADDYKILGLRPHCTDQEGLILRVLEALPADVGVVVKEHPMSIGQNSVAMLRRLSRTGRVHVMDPYTSTHELLRCSLGVTTISSTVGLEGLLYEKPVLTIGRPFYSGYGVTLDADGVEGLRERAGELLDFEPDGEWTRRFIHAAMRRCHPGAPVLVDDSDENACRLAQTLDRAATGGLDISDGLATSEAQRSPVTG